jgi:DNA-binding MarR family transcriptional regulator
VLTDAGRAALRAAAPVYLDGIGRHFTDHLTDEELRVLGAGLARVLEAAEGPGTTPPPRS